MAAGTVTMAMPASEASLAANGQLEVVPLGVAALEGATVTALPAGFDSVPVAFSFDPFRPAWPRPGYLLGRARVVNSGGLFVFAEVQLDDPEGRHLGQGRLRSAVRRVEPAPPQPPVTMRPVEEPVYETPDPYLRRHPAAPFVQLLEEEDGLTVARQAADGRLPMPLATLYGLRHEKIDEGRAVLSMPASEWFCSLDSSVSAQIVATLVDMATWTAAMSLHRPGAALAALDALTRFVAPVPADGRRLRAEASYRHVERELFVAETTVHDADGRVVALGSGSAMRIEAERRMRRPRKVVQRALLTLLFTDIVESTVHAQRLGDAAWRELLERHHLATRGEISRHNGTEVNTAGDGFFVRFDSPALAIAAARAARQAAAALGLETRAGIHTGECELEGTRLAGMAVHIAARIQTAAAPGEILVSSTVKELVVGSSLRFADRGAQTLKGVPEPWRLYSVVE